VGDMRLLHGLRHCIAIAVITMAPATARDAAQIDGWDPFRPPATEADRLPDDYVNDKPYWRPPPGVQIKTTKPRPSAAPQSTTVRSSAPSPPRTMKPSSSSSATASVPANPSSNRTAQGASSDNPMAAMAADKVPAFDPYRPLLVTIRIGTLAKQHEPAPLVRCPYTRCRRHCCLPLWPLRCTCPTFAS
jgi:outer membrane biosynthesis protein TonB